MDNDSNNPGGPKTAITPLQEYVDRLQAHYQPSSVTEKFLVDQMAYAQWRMDRFARLEATLLLEHPPTAKECVRIRKSATSARRSFQQALKTLVALRKSRAGRPARSPGTAPELFRKIEAVDFAPTA
jgi:hypothetical protein